MKIFERIKRPSMMMIANTKFVMYFIFITFFRERGDEQINHIPARSRLIAGKMNLTPSVARTKDTKAKFKNETTVRHIGNVKYNGVLLSENM